MENTEHAERNIKRLCILVVGWCIVFGTIWVILSKSDPVADQKMVMTKAGRVIEENYGRREYEG